MTVVCCMCNSCIIFKEGPQSETTRCLLHTFNEHNDNVTLMITF